MSKTKSHCKVVKKSGVWIALALGLTLLLSDCSQSEPDSRDGAPTAESATTPQSVTVALYSDNGCWEDSVTALERMFEWMGYEATLITAKEINDQSLDEFSLLCVSGGDMYQYAQDISPTGKQHIRDFVSNGGGYIGICAGAYFASEKVYWQGRRLPMTPLALFQGASEGPIDAIVPYPEYGMCQVNFVDATHPITQSESDSAWILYYWGPALRPNDDANVEILAAYNGIDQPVAVASEYGIGRIFLIGTHPEIEEDSDRDGTSFAEELDDEGSDWKFMKQAARWCLGES